MEFRRRRQVTGRQGGRGEEGKKGVMEVDTGTQGGGIDSDEQGTKGITEFRWRAQGGRKAV